MLPPGSALEALCLASVCVSVRVLMHPNLSTTTQKLIDGVSPNLHQRCTLGGPWRSNIGFQRSKFKVTVEQSGAAKCTFLPISPKSTLRIFNKFLAFVHCSTKTNVRI